MSIDIAAIDPEVAADAKAIMAAVVSGKKHRSEDRTARSGTL
jgi:hypothetical protein